MGKLKRYQYNKIDHIAGIVPIGGKALDFQMPWHDALIPVAPDYLAIEQAVYQCAVAGCDTIWIVGHKGTTPLVRHRLGDIVIDPNSIPGSEQFHFARRKEIPIFYVPILPKDYDRRDSLGWSVLHGADVAFRVSCFISKWVAPTRYFCAFPYGITSVEFIKENREKFFTGEVPTIFSYGGKSVKDGLHIPFLFGAGDYKKCRDIVRKKNIEDWEKRKERDAREFTLQEIFEPLDTANNSVVELPWFYDIGSWANYCKYTSSEQALLLKKHKEVFIREKRRIFPTEREINGEGKLEEKVRGSED